MNPTILKLALAAGAILPVFLDSALKGTLLLLVSLAAVAGLRRAAASTRHLVWATAAVALLAMPLLSLALPKWRVLPGGLPSKGAVVPVEAAGGSAVVPETVPPPAGLAIAEGAPGPVASPSVVWGGWEIVLGAWGVGVLVLLGRLAVGRWRLFQLGRRSRVAGDPIASAAAEAAAALGVRRPVRVLVGPERCMPMTWGTWRPCILLPAQAVDWTPAHLRAVLLHEIAHVRRGDTATQLVMRAACALHWFNPLAWVAIRCAEVERERACDDIVLAHGVRPTDYAGDLMQVVTRSPLVAAPHSGLAMARPSTLEKRLAAILDARLNRRRLTRGTVVLLGILGLAVACPMAMLDAAEGERPTEEQRGADLDEPNETVTRPPGTLSQLRSELSRKTAKREQLQKIYTDDHPQLKALDALIARLERGVAGLEAEQAAAEFDLPPELLRLGPLHDDASSFAGVGVSLAMGGGAYPPTIHRVLEGGPAEASGKLRESDRLLAIREAGSPRWVDLAHMHLGVVVQLIRGKPGTTVILRVSRDGGQPFEVELERRDLALLETNRAADSPQMVDQPQAPTATRVVLPEADVPVAEWLPEKLGYVYSPFDDQRRPIDVTGLPAGTLIVCPYTRETIRIPSSDPELYTRVFRVPPKGFGSDDGKRRAAEEVLSAVAGMTFPEGASAVYNEATSQLTVRNTTANLNRIPKTLEAVSEDNPTDSASGELIIALAGSGEGQTLAVNGVEVSPAELAEHLGSLDPRPQNAVVVADREVRFQQVLDVAEALKEAGVGNVAFRVQPGPE